MSDMNIRWREGIITGEPYFAPRRGESIEIFQTNTPIEGELITSKLGPLTTGPFDVSHLQNQRPERER